jgi:hypothetical protein
LAATLGPQHPVHPSSSSLLSNHHPCHCTIHYDLHSWPVPQPAPVSLLPCTARINDLGLESVKSGQIRSFKVVNVVQFQMSCSLCCKVSSTPKFHCTWHRIAWIMWIFAFKGLKFIYNQKTMPRPYGFPTPNSKPISINFKVHRLRFGVG